MGIARRSRSAKKRAAHPGIRLAQLPRKKPLGNSDDHAGSSDADGNTANHSIAVGTHDIPELTPAFKYHGIPDEVLVGSELDLSVWSVVAQDSCMLRLGGRRRPVRSARPATSSALRTRIPATIRGNQLDDALSAAVATVVPSTFPPRLLPSTPLLVNIRLLNLAGADHITDQALVTISSQCPHLERLNVEKAVKLTDIGLRHLVSRCRRLKALNVSYIPSLKREALTAIAEFQPPLQELALAGCRHIPESSLRAVIAACPALISLDLSFCTTATTDNVLLSLSQHCHALVQLRVHECRSISNDGVVSIAAGCPQLTLFDLSRSDLAYKLTDVALLAIAERCLLLQSITLLGCEMLTDVGLTWLASGCAALQRLDVSGCAKLTDLGLRAIGEQLLQLRHLTLANCVRVSNTGLRHVARGCPELTHLIAPGLTLLCDPSSSDDCSEPCGGIAAIAQLCPHLQYVDVTQCSALGDATLVQLAAHSTNLAELKLTGCTRVTSGGVQRVLKQCEHLKTLKLSGCHRLNDSAFQHGVPYRLEVLHLRQCVKITDATLTRLAGTRFLALRELDLSGCHCITDHGVLMLAESSSAHSLRQLWLRDVHALSETALSWLAQYCPRILLLDVTRCPRIGGASLRALASGWRFAKLVELAPRCPQMNQHGMLLGMAPLPRAIDRVCIEDYGTCWQAAIRIQCLFRARVAHREMARQRERQRIHRAATRLQSLYRGRCGRRLAVVRRLQAATESAAATKLQARYRRRLAEREVARRRARHEYQRVHRAARVIQHAWRGRQLRNHLTLRALGRRRLKRRREVAAMHVQRMWRGHHARLHVRALRAARVLQRYEQQVAATKVQTRFRMRMARRALHVKIDEQRQLECRRAQAARLVQAHVRRRLAQRQLGHLRMQQQRLDSAATRIQRHWRAQRRFALAQLVAKAAQHEREYTAAVRLQAAWKRKKGRDLRCMLLALREQQAQHLQASVLRVQTIWRGRRARHEAAALQSAAMARVLQQLRIENHAATRVQARFRGNRGRVEWARRVREKKRQWKAVPHPSDPTQRMYYNKRTGEVRWRCPQDVLDLLPQPRCDNCDANAALADVECQDCGEMYCGSCWARVHAGGRRRHHLFRTLYDFDGNRVDYAEGEFPSLWPSEVQQDEMNGWALRVLPHRRPVDAIGAWERYVDDESGREWFYNHETKQHSYQRPPPTESEHPPAMLWTKYWDESTGYAYYYNAQTGESTYTAPPGWLTPRAEDADSPAFNIAW